VSISPKFEGPLMGLIIALGMGCVMSFVMGAPLIVSSELGILNTKRRSIVISPNGFLLSFMFLQTLKKRNPFYFARSKSIKNGLIT
jgi:hypothetical protein